MDTLSTTREPLAPWWHTVLILTPIATCSVASWYQRGLANLHLPGMSSKLSAFVTVLAMEWIVVLLVWLALRRRGLSLGALISGRWATLGAFFKDLGIAVGFLVLVIPLLGLLIHFLKAGATGAAGGNENTPSTPLEFVVFLLLALSGSFSEELFFRGYLTQQFFAWTGSRIFAILAQGVLFGLAHGYYGRVMLAITVHGWLLGALAHWRKSLRPAMLAHGVEDVLGGTIAFLSR
jgi:membrane protease YdiL (CAAX protease family)